MTRRGNSANEPYEHDALDWYLGNQSREEIDEATVRRWDDWWDKPENRAEYVEILRLQQQTGALPRPSRSSDEELHADFKEMGAHPVARSALKLVVGRVQARPRSFFSQRNRVVIAATFAVLASVVGLLLLFRMWPADPGRTYATAPGEQRDFILQDGSSMTLGGDTSVTVRFTASGRMLVLSHGEGMFRVRHDTDRPFSVCAANGCTTAVGTVFDVRVYSNHVRVWVQEGAVDVAPRKATGVNNGSKHDQHWTPVRLAHGQEVNYDAKSGAGSTKAADPRNAAAWTNGSLIYFGRPLGEVIEDVQRYSPRRIVLDPAAAALLYSGSVVQQHIDQWIRGLAEVFPVDVTDCRVLQESIGSENAGVHSMCASDPKRILIRARVTAG